MFTIDQIEAAHARVKSGADFPGYVQELIELGVLSNDVYVFDGHAEYFGKNDYTVKSAAAYPLLEVVEEAAAEKFQHYLKIHQQGQTDYPTFCRHAAAAGIEKWTVDFNKMTCTYYDKKGNKLLVEQIPTV